MAVVPADCALIFPEPGLALLEEGSDSDLGDRGDEGAPAN
jgi:hypothetical protein